VEVRITESSVQRGDIIKVDENEALGLGSVDRSD
jgi:hypothetical protein